jgi:hypothetical protein
LTLVAGGCSGGRRRSIGFGSVHPADGSLEVQETWVVRFAPPPSTSFTRSLSATHHDGLSKIQTYLDERLLTDASGPQRAVVRLGRRPRIDWTVAPIAAGVRAFQLRYQAAATLEISGGRARFTWSILDGRHGWRIQAARVVVTAPPGAKLVETPGLAEAGWTIALRPDGIQAERTDVGPSESATVLMELDRDGLSASEPAWQFAVERASQFMPAFASAGAFILVVGLSVLLMLRILLPVGRPGAAIGATTTLDVAPDALDAEVRRVLRAGRAGWLPRRSLFAYLVSVGLADQGRVAAADGLRVTGVVCVALGMALVVVVDYTLWSYGPWTMSVPASVVAVGVLFGIVAARFGILTPAGLSAQKHFRVNPNP